MTFRAGTRSANRVTRGVVGDVDAVVDVADRAGAGEIRADQVAGDDIGRRARAAQLDAVIRVSADQVAGAAVVPPTVLKLEPTRSTPSFPLGRAADPAALVPIRLPMIWDAPGERATPRRL